MRFMFLKLTCPADTEAEQQRLRYDANASVASVCNSSLSSCRGRSNTAQNTGQMHHNTNKCLIGVSFLKSHFKIYELLSTQL